MNRSCQVCGRIIPATDQRCPLHASQFQAERNAQRRLYADPRWIELRDRKRAEQQGVCQDCGYTGANEVHHRDPVKDGHPLLCPIDRLLLLCRRCHLNRESRNTVPVDAPALGYQVTQTHTPPRQAQTSERTCFVA